MVKTLVTILMVLGMYGNCFGDGVTTTLEGQLSDEQMRITFEGNADFDEEYEIRRFKYIENKEEVIRYFLESGDICKVIGHQWVEQDPCAVNWNGNYGWTTTPCLGQKTRKCSLCGKEQKETTTTIWEDVK